MSNKTQIIPCSGWFYVYKNEAGDQFATPVAAWSLLENGDVVGLIPVESFPGNNEPAYPRLVTPPPIKGKYVLEADLPPKAIRNY